MSSFRNDPCKVLPISTSDQAARAQVDRWLRRSRTCRFVQTRDFVSKADIAAEEILKEELMTARQITMAGRRGRRVDQTQRAGFRPARWDDEFIVGMPHWAVSVALEYKGDIVAGVVYDAAKDEMFLPKRARVPLSAKTVAGFGASQSD